MKLRPGQTEVAQYKGGQLAVPSVPGAGKTTTLAYLTAKLIAESPGDKILIVTVMNSAVSNFKSKISNLLLERGLPPRGYEVKTLHSLSLLILKEKPEFLMVNEGFEILDEESRDRLFDHLAEKWLDRHQSRWESYINVNQKSNWYDRAVATWRGSIKKMFGNIIRHIKLQGFSESELRELLTNEAIPQASFLKWCLEMFSDYDHHLKRNSQVDFDDLINYAYRLLKEDPAVRARMQKRWTYIFEDEAQDSTPLQEKILYLLCEDKGNLIRVGDTNQGIMGFSGTDPSLFVKFCASVPNEPIFVASRSTRQIIDLANHFVNWVRTEYPIVACRDALEDQMIVGVGTDDPCPNPVIDEYGIKVINCPGSIEDEALAVAELAREQAGQHPDKTLAILVRSGTELTTIANILNEAGLEFDDVGKKLDKELHQISDLQSIIQYLAEPYDKGYLLKVIHVLIPDLDNDDSNILRDFLDKFDPEALLYPIGGELDWTIIPEELLTSDKWSELQRALQDITRWLEISHIRPDELVLQLAGELALAGDERDLVNSLAIQITRLLRLNPHYGLYEVVNELNELTGPVNHLAAVLKDSKGFNPRPGIISLATQHKSKGLEWDTVFVIGLGVDEYPELLSHKYKSEVWCLKDEYKNPTALAQAQLAYIIAGARGSAEDIVRRAKEQGIREQLRLLYVAFTRAKERLFISSHELDRRRDKKLAPSRILAEISRYVEVNQNEWQQK